MRYLFGLIAISFLLIGGCGDGEDADVLGKCTANCSGTSSQGSPWTDTMEYTATKESCEKQDGKCPTVGEDCTCSTSFKAN